MRKLFLSFFIAVFTLTSFAHLADAASKSGAGVYVKPYYRKDGTYVEGYYRSSPDGDATNNYSYPGNTNPYTGITAPNYSLPDTYNIPVYSVVPTPTPVPLTVPLPQFMPAPEQPQPIYNFSPTLPTEPLVSETPLNFSSPFGLQFPSAGFAYAPLSPQVLRSFR